MTTARRQLLLAAAGHFVIDAYSNSYAPLLPMLIPRLGLTLAMAGTLAMLFQVAASLAQLLFGRIADRWQPPRRLLVLGPIFAGLFLSSLGLAPSVGMLALLLTAGGLGVAAYHPAGAALAHVVGGRRPGLAMAIFISGGSLGYATAPVLFASLAFYAGPRWLPLASVMGFAMGALMYWLAPEFSTSRPLGTPRDSTAQLGAATRVSKGDGAAHFKVATSSSSGMRVLRPYLKPLGLLYMIVVLRTLTTLSFSTFVPVMLTRRGVSMSAAGAIIALYLLASGLGGFLGGTLADRFGPRRVIVLSLLLAVPPLVIAPLATGTPFIVLLVLGGFFVQSTLPVNVTFAQALAPVSAATVSSLMMGFAWGTGGLCVPLVGMIGDRVGIATALRLMALLPLGAATCAWPLPARAPMRHVSGPAMLMPELRDLE